MRTTIDISRLCLYLYIGLSGLQLLSAHDTTDQAMDVAEVKAMGQVVGQGKSQAMTHGQGVNRRYSNQTMANSTGQAIGQSGGRDMHDTQPEGKSACDFQVSRNAKEQGPIGSGQAMGESKDQALNQSKDSQNSGHGSDDHCSGRNEGDVEVLMVTGAQPLKLILPGDETAAQNLQNGNTNQAQPLVGAPPPNNAVMPVAPPPNNAVVSNGSPQQSNDGQAGAPTTEAQAANNSGASPVLASNSALSSSVASATSITEVAGVAAAMSAPTDTGPGFAGADAGACNNCQCNCPMAGFHVVQQVAMMAAMTTAPLSQSTLQTVASANEAQVDTTTTPHQSLASPIGSAPGPQTLPSAMATPPPGPPVTQTQASQAPKVASPQAQAVTAGGAADALPTNLSTFIFQSTVTVPLGKRWEPRATATRW